MIWTSFNIRSSWVYSGKVTFMWTFYLMSHFDLCWHQMKLPPKCETF